MTDRRGTAQPQERGGFAQDVRQRAIEAYDNARGSAAQAGRKATDAIGDAPLIALAGGLAAGALIAALLPRTEGEAKLLKPVGKRLTGRAKAAAEAAKEAGTARLEELGLTRTKAEETVRSIFEGATDAARTSAQAAAQAVRAKE